MGVGVPLKQPPQIGVQHPGLQAAQSVEGCLYLPRFKADDCRLNVGRDDTKMNKDISEVEDVLDL